MSWDRCRPRSRHRPRSSPSSPRMPRIAAPPRRWCAISPRRPPPRSTRKAAWCRDADPEEPRKSRNAASPRPGVESGIASPGGCMAQAIAERVAALDWQRIETELEQEGCAAAGRLLAPGECAGLQALYDEQAPFRSRIVMARHGFGSGEYKYFAYPLPA